MGREFRKRHELIVHAWGAETPVVESYGVGYSDVLECPPVSSSERQHPAEKPVNLIQQILRVCGNHVVDPFMGGGSVGVAAIMCKKQFSGVEIEQKYFDIACRRIEAAQRQLDMFLT